MSLRLLQKQTSQDSSAGGRSGGRGAWLGKKSNSGPLEDAGSADDSTSSRLYTPKGKGGRGKNAGRPTSAPADEQEESDALNGASALPVEPERLASVVEERATSGDVSPKKGGNDAQGLDAVVGLADILREASLLATHSAKAAVWCDKEGAASLEELSEAVDEFCKALALKPLQKKRFEKCLENAIVSAAATAEPPEQESVAPPVKAQQGPGSFYQQGQGSFYQQGQGSFYSQGPGSFYQQGTDHKAEQRTAAEDGLARAKKSGDVQALEAAISHAEDMDANEDLLEEAKEALMSLRIASRSPTGSGNDEKEEVRKKSDEEARWRQEEEEAQIRAEEEKRLLVEEARRAEENVRIQAEKEAKLKAEEKERREEELRVKADEDARLQAEQEERIRREAEEESRQKAEEARLKAEEQRRQKADDDARRLAELEAKQEIDDSGALGQLRKAVEARDPVGLTAALKRAEKERVDKEEIAAAKRVVFQLQKEKREQAKVDKEKKEALSAVEVASSGNDCIALQEAIARAEKVGATAAELEGARERLETLQAQAKQELVQLALEDVEYAIEQNDVESATLALEEAVREGADADAIEPLEKRLAELRERLDPEGEARRRRVEARKNKEASQGLKKWNFSGKSKNNPVNDRLREHEAELEARRVLAFRGRGRFKGNAEDEGEDMAEKEVKKLRAETIKEKGAVPIAAKVEVQKGFQWGRSPKEESEAPRKLRLQAHREMGAGIDLHASWWGMFVDAIDDEPGQPGLRLKDTIIDVNGTSLRELEAEDCEQRFADLFGDGSFVTVEPYVELVGFLTAATTVDKASLQADCERFAADWGVELRMEEAGAGGTNLRILMEGSQSAAKESKHELEKLMSFYTGS